MSFDDWLVHFRANPERQNELEQTIDWDAPASLDERTRRALARSFQRFELGENGDGEHLLRKAAAAGDSTYLAALELLVQEEQRHSVLFGTGLDRLDAPRLEAHWSDAAFTVFRRMLGLRTELSLFLIAETVAMGYFTALAERAPDPVLRGIGLRIATDEKDHIRFQIDRLHQGFRDVPGVGRLVIGAGWGIVAAAAALVVVLDHGPALRACGLSPLTYWGQAMGEFRRAATLVLARSDAPSLGPSEKTTTTVFSPPTQRSAAP